MVSSPSQNQVDSLSPHFLSCDWGTSSFRLSLVNLKTGDIAATIANDKGTKKIYKEWQSTGEPKDRVGFYQAFLKRQVRKLERKQKQDIDPWPLLISGMASSSIGIKELPYGSLPFTLDQPHLPIETFKKTDQFPHKTYLVSGLQSKSDIMRGEETELLGLFASAGITDGLYLLAGTHSKHITVKKKNVVDFNTYMTGELFELLSSESILSNSIRMQQNDEPGPSFKKGINRSSTSNLLNQLFSIRANDILNQSDPLENYDYLSGLLIGTELKDIPHQDDHPIALAGNRQLQNYYAAALDILGHDYIQPELSSQKITSLGQRIIFNQLTTRL